MNNERKYRNMNNSKLDNTFFHIRKEKDFDSHKNVNVVKTMLFLYLIAHHRVYISTKDKDDYIFQIKPYIKDDSSRWSKIQANKTIEQLTKWLFDSTSTYTSTTDSVVTERMQPIASFTLALIFIDEHHISWNYNSIYRFLRDCFKQWKGKAAKRIGDKYNDELYGKLLAKLIEESVDKFLKELKMYFDFASGKLEKCIGIILPDKDNIRKWLQYRSTHNEKLTDDNFPLFDIENRIMGSLKENPFYFNIILSEFKDEFDSDDLTSISKFLKKSFKALDTVGFDRNLHKYIIEYSIRKEIIY